MGIKMLRGTTGRSRRGVFSRELVDFETRFERVWPEHDGIVPANPDTQLVMRDGGLEVNNREVSVHERDEQVGEPDHQGIGLNLMPSGSCNGVQWEIKTDWRYFIGPPATAVKYFDPTQGCADTCGLLAALASIAWVKPSFIIDQQGTTCSYTFYDPDGVLSSSPVTVTKSLKTDSGRNHIYARCDPASSSTFCEIWPGVYEKAWAKWLLQTSSDNPNIPGAPPKNPLYALQALTQTTNANAISGTSATYANIPVDGTGKTTRCTVAWTYSDRNSIYTNSGLSPSHAYSVLGRFTYLSNNYIVLRNPYGSRIAGTEPTVDILMRGPGGSTWNGIDLSRQTDGVFALLASKFTSHFWKYGYTPTPVP